MTDKESSGVEKEKLIESLVGGVQLNYVGPGAGPGPWLQINLKAGPNLYARDGVPDGILAAWVGMATASLTLQRNLRCSYVEETDAKGHLAAYINWLALS